MKLFDLIKEFSPPCSIEQIREAEKTTELTLPTWYAELLLKGNGAELDYFYNYIGEDYMPFTGYLDIEKAVSLYKEYDLKEMGLFPFGACDGQSFIGFDTHDHKIYFVWADTGEKFYLADSIDELAELVIRESIAFNNWRDEYMKGGA